VVGGLPLPPGGLGDGQQAPGEFGLLSVDGQELGRGLEVRTCQAPLTELTPRSMLVGAIELQRCR
jgi:hypothetical protein